MNNYLNPNRLSAAQLSLILNISEDTVKKLGTELPSFKIKNRNFYTFNEVLECLKRLEAGAA